MKQIYLRNKNLFATVDDADYDRLSSHTWHAVTSTRSTQVYAATTEAVGFKKRRRVLMHRMILGTTDPRVIVDHIDHDTLRNTRDNLRVATQRQNQQNQKSRVLSSPFKGVSKSSNKNKPWRAQIRTDSKRVWLGDFTTEIEAAECYDKAASQFHGQFAYLNFPIAA